ncbi:MAG: alkaline phosphatase [Thermoanaerobaculum sp.]|nr:alkaline phosphatase [Thermoanaerobaculum sp.]
MRSFFPPSAALAWLLFAWTAEGQSINIISPPPASTLAVGQRFDVQAEGEPIQSLTWQVSLNGQPLPGAAVGTRFVATAVTVDRPGTHVLEFRLLKPGGGQEPPQVVAVARREFRALGWPKPEGRVRHVVLLVGDGFGFAHRTAARAFLFGFEGGKSRGWLRMDTLPVAGALLTSSLSGFVTDSAAAAHAFATGTKTANGMMGVFPDATADDGDNPRVETLPCLLHRTRGMVSGLVSDADLTDATPAAFLAHVADRGEAARIAQQILQASDECGVHVLLGGGKKTFSSPNLLPSFAQRGFVQVFSQTELEAAVKSKPSKILGLFAERHMHSPFDLQRRGDPAVVGESADQPSLAAMTRAAIQVLGQNPFGFFLLVEAALIDKQAHMLDAERMLWEVYNLDQALQVALEFAAKTNGDADPTNDTLVILTADHETGGVVLPGVTDPERIGTRDQVATYDRLGFPEAADANGDGYPDNPDPAKKVVVHFGAAPDHYDDFRSQNKPVAPAKAGPDKRVHANPEKDGSTGVLYTGVSEVTVPEQGYAPDRGLHTAVEVPLAALGPGAQALAGVHENTEVFFAILQALSPPNKRPRAALGTKR